MLESSKIVTRTYSVKDSYVILFSQIILLVKETFERAHMLDDNNRDLLR